jgi:malonate-semialdehyde dehydrogenase (acetylating) / methylmalonate-semialdehyde dehydrogenase
MKERVTLRNRDFQGSADSVSDNGSTKTTVPLISNFVSGDRVSGLGSEHDVFDPSTGEVTGRVAFSTTADVNAAVSAAKTAFNKWADVPSIRRARILNRALALMNEHKVGLAAKITSEHGKTLSDALGEVERGIDVVEYACGIPHLLQGRFSEQVSTDMDNWTTRQPLGVVAGITPFNFPVMVPAWMWPIAIASGNTFVLKPSPIDPSPSLLIAEILKEAGLPDGVFNVVQGDKTAVDTLLLNPDVMAVSFVGSTPIARYIYEAGARNGKRVQALGGAKNHMVVMPDVDRDKVVDALMGAAYGSAGERCMATSVAILVGNVADDIVDLLRERANTLKVGSGLDGETEMGPIVTATARGRIINHIDTGVAEGADLLVDGRSMANDSQGGFYLGPTLFDNVDVDMTIYREEIFGPVLCCVRVDSLDAAIDVVNGHDFGNGASIFTDNGGAARRFSREVQVGMVGINVPIPVPMAWHGFGGWKKSIFGDMYVYGEEGVRFYTSQKSVMQRWLIGQTGADFSMPVSR